MVGRTTGNTGKAKRFGALARVSSREQEREGFSLDVQESALKAYAQRHNGTIVKLFRVAETASKAAERKTFKEMIAWAKANATELDGLLFYKVDRAARNLFDYVELERLESRYGIQFISVSQPTDNNPAGRMQRRMLANMASYYTEQQSLDVREGLARRAQEGLFVGHTPYGYRNVRVNGRSVVEVHPQHAKNVQYIFRLYAYENHTLDMIVHRMARESVAYTASSPEWARSKVHRILRDRSYIGELLYGGQWQSGSHTPIVDRVAWDRVQVLLGDKSYKSHELTFAGKMIRCGQCGAPITGETITKKTSGKEYVYYRCSTYTRPGHERVRLTERQLDQQVLVVFAKIQQPDPVREWFGRRLRDWAVDEHQQSRVHTDDLQRQLTSLRAQQDRLLNLRLLEEIDADTYAAKHTELRDRIAKLTLEMEAADRCRDEQADLAQRVFELSQNLQEMWVTSDCAEKRQILEMVFLNLRLDAANLAFEMRKPFDVLAEGLLVPSSRGTGI